jgi:hypothetical protein
MKSVKIQNLLNNINCIIISIILTSNFIAQKSYINVKNDMVNKYLNQITMYESY